MKRSATELFTPVEYADTLGLAVQANSASQSDNTSDHQSEIGSPTLKRPSLFNMSEMARLVEQSRNTLVGPRGFKELFLKGRSYLLGTPLSLDSAHLSLNGEAQQTEAKSWLEMEVQQQFDAQNSAKKVSFEEIREFQRDLMGSDDIFSEDEKFLRYSYGTKYWS